MKIKTALRFYLTPVRITTIKNTSSNECWWGCGERVHSYIAGGTANWYNHYGKQDGDSLENLEWNNHSTHFIPLLSIYPKNLKSAYYSDTATSMFIAAQCTIAKLQNQPRCPSTDECIKKMWYIYTMEYYSAIKNEIMAWMELK